MDGSILMIYTSYDMFFVQGVAPALKFLVTLIT